MERVGFTTSIPVEIILAAHRIPVDLNNLFITHPHRRLFLEEAEVEGFPRNLCGWIKGIYRAALNEGIADVVAVTQGDCSNTQALMELLQDRGINIIPFSFPYDRDRESLRREIHKLMERFGVTEEQVEKIRRRLQPLRHLLKELDRLTWDELRVTGGENHYYLVRASDCDGNVEAYTEEVKLFLRAARRRAPRTPVLRLAYLGVPPIYDDLYDYLEAQGVQVIFNETQRQFAMPFEVENIIDQYLLYTYPYNVFHRLEDIQREAERRRPQGFIHYVQAFCYRQIEDILLRKYLKRPVITLEGDRPSPLDARARLRLETFLTMLGQNH